MALSPSAPEYCPPDEAVIAAQRPDSTPVTDPRLSSVSLRTHPHLAAQPPSGPVPDRQGTVDKYNPVG